MSYKYIKCHKCFGKGCSYCGYTGIVSMKRGNKKKIDTFYDKILKRRSKRRRR